MLTELYLTEFSVLKAVFRKKTHKLENESQSFSALNQRISRTKSNSFLKYCIFRKF